MAPCAQLLFLGDWRILVCFFIQIICWSPHFSGLEHDRAKFEVVVIRRLRLWWWWWCTIASLVLIGGVLIKVCFVNLLITYSVSFSKSWNCTRRSGSCNFSFLKNSLVQINSKLNEKNRMITYTNIFLVISCGCTVLVLVTLSCSKNIHFFV